MQYQALTAPLLPSPPETITADKWQPVRPVASLRRSRQLLTANQRVWGSTITTPTLVTTQAGATGDYAQVGRVHSTQYMMLTAPFAPEEALPPDPWHAAFVSCYPTYALKRRVAKAPWVWGQPHFAAITIAPVMSWTGVYLDPPPKRRRIRQMGGMFAPPPGAEIAPPTGWGKLSFGTRNRLVRVH